MMDNVLVCGASGMLGRTLCKSLKHSNINYIGTYNSNKYDDLIKLDFFNTKEIETTIVQNNINVVINLIAERRPNICENDWKHTCDLNIKIVENLVRICNELDIHLIHLSTDYVFDGLSEEFNPNSLTNPLQNYGISKLMGELRIRSLCKSSYQIIRVSVLYSLEQKNLKESSVTVIGKQLMDIRSVKKIDNHYIRRAVNCAELSKFIIDSINKRTTGISHFFNPNDKYTKYSMGYMMGQELRIRPSKGCVPNTTALRPYDIKLRDENNNYEYKSSVEEDLHKIFQKYYYPTIKKDNKNDYLLLLDLDGTIITESIHHKVYKDLFKEHDIDFTYEDYLKATNYGSITEYACEHYNIERNVVDKLVKNKRKQIIKSEYPIELIDGFIPFLETVINRGINIAVVTNSPKSYTDFVKRKLPILNDIKQWVTREDYKNPKPHKEPYMTAIEKYGKNEKYIIGFENSINGVRSLEQVTNYVYGCVQEYDLSSRDVFSYDNYYNVVGHMFLD